MATFELPSGAAARNAGQPLLMLALLVLLIWTTPARGQYVVAGRITDGTVGVRNVTVQTVGQTTSQLSSTTTDSNGDYSLSLGGDTYTVTPTKANAVLKPLSCLLQLDCPTNATVTVGLNLPAQTNVDFSVVYDVGGHVTDGTTGLSGVQVTVQAYPQTAVTDSSGNYTLSGFRSASYTLNAAKANYTFDPASLVVNVTSNVTDADFTAYPRFSVSGRITNARSPAPNVNVALQNVSSLVTLTDVTDTSGAFSFTNLDFAVYTVTPSLLGYTFNPTSYSVSNQASVNFSVATQNLTGHITDGTSGLGIANVAVDAIAGTNVSSTFTDVNGNYAFKNLAGTYLIVASQAGQQFNPARRTLSVGSGPGSVDFQREPTLFDVLVTSCDFPSLRLALSSGGTVGFDCGGTVGTIAVTETITIPTNAVLDAQEVSATLSGGNAVRIFTVNPSVHFTLNHLTLTAGKDAGANGTNGNSGISGRGGALLNDGGVIVLSN